jgi:hypothetical protein
MLETSVRIQRYNVMCYSIEPIAAETCTFVQVFVCLLPW